MLSYAHNQRLAILSWLNSHPNLDTLQARQHGIMHPSGRILELKRQGYKIKSHRAIRYDSQGNPRRVAVYVLEVSK
jgi:hypothetical protein